MKQNKYTTIGAWTLLIMFVIFFYGYTKMADSTISTTPLVATNEDRGQIPTTEERLIDDDDGWTGVASYYSRAGCIGCSPTLTMANGEPLDDHKKTIAFNKLPLGTKVRVMNLDNYMTTTATITDTGGFERLGRIADLTIATRDALNCGGLCRVKIIKL